MTKPGFIKKRLIALFASDDVVEQQRVVDNYNRIRNKQCYCGHTDECDCSNPGIYEFKHSLMSNSISEEVLDKVIEKRARIHKSPTIQRLLDEMKNDPWYVKLKRWWRLKVWVYTCLTRKYWDKSFEGYIFKKKKYE